MAVFVLMCILALLRSSGRAILWVAMLHHLPAPPPRRGATLARAARAFADEDTARSWRELMVTMALWTACSAIVWFGPGLIVRTAASVLLGLTLMRLFIFFHDAAHGAIFRHSPWGRRLTTAIGYFALSTPSTWDRDHHGHHKTVARPLSESLESYPPGEIIDRFLTVDQWAQLGRGDRLKVRALVHPALIVLGSVTTFMLAHCTLPFLENPRRHWDGPIALMTWWTAFVGLGLAFGWTLPVLWLAVPHVIAASLGTYIFFAQHNFAETRIGSPDWHPIDAALAGSSLFEMPGWMHWFTGNIGYHHVHHVCARIPFYRLPEAMDALPELQRPGRTSWRLGDVLANLSASVWCVETQRLVSFAQADRLARLEPHERAVVGPERDAEDRSQGWCLRGK